MCESIRELELQQNDIGNRGVRALQAVLSQCPELERLALWGNCIEPEGQEALLQAWLQAGKNSAGLEVGDQRKPMLQVEIDTSSRTGSQVPLSPSPKSPRKGAMPISPVAARRSADEMAALQMAELGARQAAFEARLHVAINRISSTLFEVGDAVGGTPSSIGTTTTHGMTPQRSPVSPTFSFSGGRSGGYQE